MEDYILKLRRLVGHRPLLLAAAGAILIDEAQKSVLLQRRTDNGTWAIHGGIMEPGESTVETAVRELWEETGLRMKNPVLLDVFSGPELHNIYPNGDECYFMDAVYVSADWEGELKPQAEEVMELRWFPIDALPRAEEINPADHKSIFRLRDNWEKTLRRIKEERA